MNYYNLSAIITNIKLKKNQECEVELTQKGEMVERLQAKASSIGRILTSLEKKYTSTHGEDSSDLKKSPSGQLFSYHHQPPNKRAHLKIQQIPPFNANKVRKSPSSEAVEEQELQQEKRQSTNLTDEVLTEEPVKNEE